MRRKPLKRAGFALSAHRLRAGVAALLIAASAAPASANYLLQPGDVIEVIAFSAPTFRHRIAIDLDGKGSFPLIGEVPVAGRDISAVRAELGKLLAGRDFRVIGSDGREAHLALSAEEFGVSIAEYRPVFVNGDVASPGAQSFRPGLTVRQAVAVAGGFDLLRMKLSDPFVVSVEARVQLESLKAELVRENLKLDRLRAELDEREFRPTQPTDEPIGQTSAELEKLNLGVALGDARNQREHLGLVIGQVEQRLASLRIQSSQERDGSRLDKEEFDKVNDLLARGVVPSTRATDARRISLLSATRFLETSVQASQAEKDGQDLRRQLVSFNAGRKLRIIEEIRTSMAKISDLGFQTQGASEKLKVVAAMKSQLGLGKLGEKEISVIRTEAAKRIAIAADEDTALLPGDTVEITFRLQELEKFTSR